MNSQHTRRPLLCAALIIALAIPVGCKNYEAQPLNLDATRSAWLARSPDDQSVRAFADALAAREGSLPAVFDPMDGLTLAEGEPVALVFNRELRVERLRANVTLATAENAGLWEDPTIGVDALGVANGTPTQWVVAPTISLTIPISGRLEAEKLRAGAAYHAALQRLVALEWATRSSLREHWIEWSAQSSRAQVLCDLAEQLRAVADLAQRQEQAGVMSRIDARLFRVELAGAEADLIAARARARELQYRLRDLLGISPNAPVTFVESVTFVPHAGTAAWSLEAIESGNPELAAVREEYEVAEHTLRTEIRKQYPDVTIGPGIGSDSGNDLVMLGVEMPVPAWNRNRQGVAEATAQRDVARGRFESTYEHLASTLAIAQTRYDAGREVRESVEMRVLPLADEQDAEVRRVAKIGHVDPLLLLRAIQSQADAKMRLLDARAAESTGAIQLDELVGPPTADALAPVKKHEPISGANR